MDDSPEYLYSCSYEYRGERYSVDIQASDYGDADARLRAIGHTGRCDVRTTNQHGPFLAMRWILMWAAGCLMGVGIGYWLGGWC